MSVKSTFQNADQFACIRSLNGTYEISFFFVFSGGDYKKIESERKPKLKEVILLNKMKKRTTEKVQLSVKCLKGTVKKRGKNRNGF